MAQREQDEEESRYRRSVAFARDKAVAARDKASEFVENRPLTSVAAAAAIGALIGAGVTALMMRPKPRSFWDRFGW